MSVGYRCINAAGEGAFFRKKRDRKTSVCGSKINGLHEHYRTRDVISHPEGGHVSIGHEVYHIRAGNVGVCLASPERSKESLLFIDHKLQVMRKKIV